MKCTKIKYHKTNYFSKTVTDYLSQNESIKPFYNKFPTLENFENQLSIHLNSKTNCNRRVLVESLKFQYRDLKVSTKTTTNIELLLKENTFTITTGHQLNLFTGPLYFLYKIISTINLAEELTVKYPKQNFVPVYWMATEDHDFEEINFFNFKSEKIQWDKESKTAVGKLDTKGLEPVLEILKFKFGVGKNAKYLIELFEKSYLKNNNLTEATRYLANELFSDYGLVIIDAADKNLKELFIPFIKDELINQTSYKEVSKTISSFKKEYKVQVNPREINLFYLTDNFRERIIFEDGIFKINNTSITFSEKELLNEVRKYPERFSPNVIMRPLYQEVILPNLCYIGGGGELAYWFELKNYFEKVGVIFPMLLLRNSVLIMTEKQENKLQKLNTSSEDLFLKQDELIAKMVREQSNLKLDFSDKKEFLKQQFQQLKGIAKQTDRTFVNAVMAQETKQLKGLNVLEKRLLKAEKRKLSDLVLRIKSIQNQLFPNYSLQERNTNFSELYLEFGEELIPFLKEHLKPLKLEFTVLTKRI